MMSYFEIDVRSVPDVPWDTPQGISVRSGGVCFTELIRDGENKADDYLNAPPVQLAFWVTDNWWRLRWEPVVSNRSDPNWRLAHELSAIGGGYVWPRLQIWGEDTHVGLASHSDSHSMNFALRYTKDALMFVPAEQFEIAVDKFLEQAIDAESDDKAALGAQFAALKEERNDKGVAAWRRLEAMLGYDVDRAPDQLIEILLEHVGTYGQGGVEEAIVASQGETATATLEEEINVAKRSGIVCDLCEAVAMAGNIEKESDRPIWEIAEKAAISVRQGMGSQNGPLRNTRLAELLNVSRDVFRGRESKATRLHYGLRLRVGTRERNRIALRARRSQGRRFELCRTLGDAIWSDSDALGPITKTGTRRQQFQRTFAQSLLCPYDGLRSYIDNEKPSDEDILAAAQHFHVSERVIQTVLVNKGIVDRHQFDEWVDAA